jgi:DNA-binding transcriptional ArsR family regulator
MDRDVYNVFDATYFRTLTHPLRLRILAMLGERPSSPARLAAMLAVRTNVVAYHVKRLRELGLVELVDVRRGRGGLEHFYTARRAPTLADEAWADLAPHERAALLEVVLTQIGQYLSRAAVTGGFNRPDVHISRTPVRVDEQGWAALAGAARDWLRAVAAVECEVVERGSDELFDAGVVILLFEARPFSDGPARGRSGGHDRDL